MKKTAFVLLFALMAQLMSGAISYIRRDGSWYKLYDEKGKSYKTLSASSVGSVIGWSSEFFIARNGSWYIFYDAGGKRYRSASVSSIGEIVSVTGDTFTAINGSWVKTYSKEGKLISTRSAH